MQAVVYMIYKDYKWDHRAFWKQQQPPVEIIKSVEHLFGFDIIPSVNNANERNKGHTVHKLLSVCIPC